MLTTADQRRREVRQPLHPPKKYHHAPSIPKRRAPSNTLKRECDDAAVVARTSSRVSPGTRGIVRKGVPDAPQESPTVPAGVIPSVPARPTGISPDPQPPPPPQAFRNAPPPRPPTSLCHHDYRRTLPASLELSTRGLERKRRHQPRERPPLDRKEGTASTATAGPTGRGDEDLPGLDGPAGPTWTRTVLSEGNMA